MRTVLTVFASHQRGVVCFCMSIQITGLAIRFVTASIHTEVAAASTM